VDDVNPIVITRNTTALRHDAIVRQVDSILNEEAERYRLSWDPEKQTRLDYKGNPSSKA